MANPEIQFELSEEKIKELGLEADSGIEKNPQPEILQPDEYEHGGESRDNLQAVKERYGEGDWEKSWDSAQDAETKYNRAENYMELAGPEGGGQNLTEQIKGGQYESRHLEILDGWKNNPTETQFVEHKEIVGGEEVLHITAITLGPDDIIHSETWTRKLEKHEKNLDDDGLEDNLFGENFESDDEPDAEDASDDKQKNSEKTFAFASVENKENQDEPGDENFDTGIELFQNNADEETSAPENLSGISLEAKVNFDSKTQTEPENFLNAPLKTVEDNPGNNFELEQADQNNLETENPPTQNIEIETPENEICPGITLEIFKPAEEKLIKNENNRIEVEASEPVQIFQRENAALLEKKSEITNELIEKNNTEIETLKEKPEIVELNLKAETGLDLVEVPADIQVVEEKSIQPIEIKIIEFQDTEQANNETLNYSPDSGITIQAKKMFNISEKKENNATRQEDGNTIQKENRLNFNQKISSEAEITITKKEIGQRTEADPVLVRAEINQPAEKENIKETSSPEESVEIGAPETKRENKENLIFNDIGITLNKETARPKPEAEIKNAPESNNPEIQKNQLASQRSGEKVINLFDRLSAPPMASHSDEEIIADNEEEMVSLNNFGISLIKQAA